MAGHRTTTFSAGSHVPAASLNTQQDRAHTLDLATATAAGAPTDTQGADWITYQSPDAGIPTGDVVTLDASDRDWRERILNATARFVTVAARRWGRADEHVGNDPASCNVRTALGVTGPGAYGAASAAVAAGVPPVVAAGSCPVALDVRSDGEIWIFADPTNGNLKLYNDTTTTLHLDLLVMATGRAPDLSAPPPDLVPTLTEVLWLTPTTAAARPADPGAVIALHRATDTGAVTLWDGGAWRTIGLVSPLTTRGDVWVRDGSGDARLALGTHGYALRAGATDPGWGVVSASDSALPTAGADYAGATYWLTTTGGFYVCLYGGATPAWGWRVLDVFRGAIDTTGTPDDTFKVVASVTLPTNTVALLDLDVAGIKNDHSTGIVARGSAGFITDGTTATELDALTLAVGDPTRVRLVGNGLAVDVEIKGVAAEDWTWRARITVRAEVTA